MQFTYSDINNLLTIIQSGRGSALTAPQIENRLHNQFNFPTSGNQHIARALIKYAIANGHLIKSSTANPPGFWLTSDKSEIVKNINSLRRRAQRTNNSAETLKNTWNTNNPTDFIP